MSPNAGNGGRGVAGSQSMRTAVHMDPKLIWRSNSIFNLWNKCMLRTLKYIELKTTTPSSFFAVGGGRGWGSGVCTTPDATAWSEL